MFNHIHSECLNNWANTKDKSDLTVTSDLLIALHYNILTIQNQSVIYFQNEAITWYEAAFHSLHSFTA